MAFVIPRTPPRPLLYNTTTAQWAKRRKIERRAVAELVSARTQHIVDRTARTVANNTRQDVPTDAIRDFLSEHMGDGGRLFVEERGCSRIVGQI